MIRAARALLGLEQSQLADIVGVARRTIIRIEADDTEPTNPRRIEIHKAIRDRLEKKFGVLRLSRRDRRGCCDERDK